MGIVGRLTSLAPFYLLKSTVNFYVASQRCIDLIMKYEGCVLTAYPDPGTGGDPWTIGYGHTGPEVVKGLRITKDQAIDWLMVDVDKHGAEVNKLVKTRISQNQFDALTSLVFNIGVNAFRRSTLLRLLNAGKFDEAANEFPKWNKAGGRVMQGLVNRRASELALFLRND